MIRKIKYLVLFLLIFFLAYSPSQTFAQELKETMAPIAPPQSTQSATIEYNLPFPGILPDHPFYKIKVLRDKISAALISDPLKKIEFLLLQTDKGILATAMLIDKGKVDLAEQTALKAEHNYTLITQGLYRLPIMLQEAFFKKLKTASQKHQEVLASLVKRVDKDRQKTFLTVIDFSKRNWNTIEEYKNSEKERN